MQLIRHPLTATTGHRSIELSLVKPWLVISLLVSTMLICGPALGLETDRQKPLEVNANSTDGTLGDGVTTLRGDVDIRQGTLHITADQAEVIKADGKVQKVTFVGKPASLQQEIEEQGLVKATANSIDYQVATGLVTLKGNADVTHPQYQISGDLLTYDLNIQHFEGNGDNGGEGRIRIRLDPEVLDDPSFSTGGKKSGDNKNNQAVAPATVTPQQDQSEVAPEDDAPFADDANPVDDFDEFSDPDGQDTGNSDANNPDEH